MPETQDNVIVKGPDGKKYNFPKGTTKDKAVAYFKKKGISAPKQNTSSGFTPGPDPLAVKKSMQSGMKKEALNTLDVASRELPAVGGAGFGMAAGSKKWPGGMAMAGLGGMAGAAGNEIIQRLVFDRSGSNIPSGETRDTNINTIKYMVGEGIKQAGLEGAGRGAGELFFKLLSKIPHARIVNGIPLLPSDLGQGGKVSKYVEDLLTNLVPSAKTMAEFKDRQNAAVIGQAEKLAKGFSRFRGTSEEFGILIRDTMQKFRVATNKALGITLGEKTSSSVVSAFGKAQAVQDAEKVFLNELAEKVVKTKKPELIAGFIRAKSGLEDTRTVLGYLGKEEPKVVNAAKTRIMMDVIQETLTGTKDPILKSLQKQDTKFVGNKFKQVVDKIGEEKLKVIYGENGFKNIEEFSKLIEHVGANGSNGAGKFLNLIFLLGPIRTGLTIAAGKKLVTEGFIFNRAAKIITSTAGVQAYENYIRASSIGSVKAISAARDVLRTLSDQADQEYHDEQEKLEEEYYKEHPDELKYKNSMQGENK